jgi:hypothetical protein
VHEIVLAPLELDDVGRLIADALHCEPGRARPLAELVHEKTGGNPFFTIQFFMELAEERLLAFDPATRAWQWNIDRIRAKSFTDNVVDLMTGKLKRFSSSTQQALKQLACLGNVAGIATLTTVHGTTEEATQPALREAVRAGLVLHRESAFRFLHDRIQQAAYSLIPDEERADAHLRIGRALLADMTADELAEHLFDIANQFNRGAQDHDLRRQIGGALTVRRHPGCDLRRHRLAVRAEMGRLCRHHVFERKRRPVERLSGAQQPRSDRRTALPVLILAQLRERARGLGLASLTKSTRIGHLIGAASLASLVQEKTARAFWCRSDTRITTPRDRVVRLLPARTTASFWSMMT